MDRAPYPPPEYRGDVSTREAILSLRDERDAYKAANAAYEAEIARLRTALSVAREALESIAADRMSGTKCAQEAQIALTTLKATETT